MIQAIVYTSNTGFTAEYARLLGEATGLPVQSLPEALQNLQKNAEIIYLGWIMAGTIKDYKKAAGAFQIKAACGVGMMEANDAGESIRKSMGIPADIAVFPLQGGLNIPKLHGVYKPLLKTIAKVVAKKAKEKPEKTQADLKMIEVAEHGGSFVSKENLSDILAWYEKQK